MARLIQAWDPVPPTAAAKMGALETDKKFSVGDQIARKFGPVKLTSFMGTSAQNHSAWPAPNTGSWSSASWGMSLVSAKKKLWLVVKAGVEEIAIYIFPGMISFCPRLEGWGRVLERPSLA